MKKLFEIKHRFTGNVLFSLECGSLKICVEAAVKAKADLGGADLRGAYLRGAALGGAALGGADLRCADLGGADLRGADLGGADLGGAALGGADLGGAYLRGAYLRGADSEKIKITKTPIQVLTDVYDIIIFDSHMRIGCEFHSLKDWWSFDDRRILEMDNSTALKFWKTWKKPLRAICRSNERV